MFGIGLLGTVLTHIGLMGIMSDLIDVCCQPLVGIIGTCYACGYTIISIGAYLSEPFMLCLNWLTEFCIGIIPFI